MKKIIVFDIWGDYGHFKKYYTTTSPLTFSFPPRPTISGIISALIGLDKREYLNFFSHKDAYITLRILNPVTKVRMGVNLRDTEARKKILFVGTEQRTRILTEYIKDPKYRIYFWHSNEQIYKRVKESIERHESVYTVSLGLSELIANFSFVGEYEIKTLYPEKTVEIDSVIPSEMVEISFETGKEYFSTTMPGEMIEGRIVTKYSDVSYEQKGQKILCRPASYCEIENGENIIFL